MYAGQARPGTRPGLIHHCVTSALPETGNRYNLNELAGAFGDLGTLVPFLAAYIAILKMDGAAVLLGVGVALIVVGALYRTPFPVQPLRM